MSIDEPTTDIVHYLLNELISMTAKRDHYRDALKQIVDSPLHLGHICDTCRIALTALDGEA
jgi:hypothetical protein